MAMATVLQLPYPGTASSELQQRKMTKSSTMSRTSTMLCGELETQSPNLQFCSCRRRGPLAVGTLSVPRSSANAEKIAETENVRLLAFDSGDNIPRPIEFVQETEIGFDEKTEIGIKSCVANLMAKMQLLGALIALGMVIGVRVAAATVTGSPMDGKKKNFLCFPPSVSASMVPSDCSDKEGRDLSAAHSPEAQDRRRMKIFSSKGSKRDGGKNCGGGVHRDRIEKHGVALAAEIEGTDEEARAEYEEWQATPYALTVPLRLVGLRGSVPPVWLKGFASSQGKRVKLVAEFQANLLNIFTELSSALISQQQLTPKSALAADLVTIGDSWLGKAVSRNLITPIENAEKYEWFQRLGPKWQAFLRRNQSGDVDPNGKVYAVPYRWGSVVIAYNRKKFQQHGISAIEDWEDLWRPELAGKIAMISSPRDVIGAVLKSLGASYNARNLETNVPGGRQTVKEKFHKLQQQVLVFDNIQYLKILGAGEVWVAVGWSADVIPFAKRTSNISVITPRSGTSLWADLWAIPATPRASTKVGGRIRGPSPLVHQWLDFCLQSERANSFKDDVFVGASPLDLPRKPAVESSSVEVVYIAEGSVPQAEDIVLETDEEKPSSLRKDSFLVSQDPLERSEFLEPLSPAASEDFQWLLSTSAEVPRYQLKSLVNRFRNLFGRRAASDS